MANRWGRGGGRGKGEESGIKGEGGRDRKREEEQRDLL